MPSQYSQRSLTVLALFGVLAAIMTALSVILIFQVQAAVKQGEPVAGMGPGASRFLLAVSAVLAALCLALNTSCLLLCLLHSYFTAEVCREDPESGRGDWFLLDNRSIRHAAIALFCLGISLYLAALSLYMLILFEIETGIASACILSSGALVMIITVTHTLHKASLAARESHDELPSTLYENDSANGMDTPSTDLNNGKEVSPVRPRPEIHREFSYPPFLQQQQHQQQKQQQQKPLPLSPALSNLASMGKQSEAPSHGPETVRYNIPRMHRTLSAESGLMQPQPKPRNGMTQEMRTVISRKPGVVGKDSTLV
ncbi:hypothetical protein FKM82_019683 [Ascaphus truei]